MTETFIDVHHIKERYEKTVERFNLDERVSARNKELVTSFLRDAALGKTVLFGARRKIREAKLTSYIKHFCIFIDYVNKDLDKVEQIDVEKFVEALDRGKILSRQVFLVGRKKILRPGPLSESYRAGIKTSVKKLYKWLWGECRTYPKMVDWIDTYCPRKEIAALTEAEIQALIDMCQKTYHKAVIQTMFDGGFRIGELLNIRLKHVTFRGFSANDSSLRCFFLRVPFSKPFPRTVSLPMENTTKWLMLWLKDHPAHPTIREDGTLKAEDMEKQLFPRTVNAVRILLAVLGKKVLGKRVWPHLLRHTSATYWSNKLPYFKFCKRFGWTMTSKMPQRYIDVAGVDEMEVAEIYHHGQAPVRERFSSSLTSGR